MWFLFFNHNGQPSSDRLGGKEKERKKGRKEDRRVCSLPTHPQHKQKHFSFEIERKMMENLCCCNSINWDQTIIWYIFAYTLPAVQKKNCDHFIRICNGAKLNYHWQWNVKENAWNGCLLPFLPQCQAVSFCPRDPPQRDHLWSMCW